MPLLNVHNPAEAESKGKMVLLFKLKIKYTLFFLNL